MNKSGTFFHRDVFLHLRLPFSFFLLPVFLFAVSQSLTLNAFNLTLLFIALHFFIYPGSNIYNSYMDEDKGSIGGLKHPPPVTRKMYEVSILFDAVGLSICTFISFKMTLLAILYIMVSKVYSWKRTRLKKYAVTGWLIVMLFQGGYTFMMVNMATENIFNNSWFTGKHILGMFIASLLIGGYYPLTQIYQHEEDKGRGDMTISLKLGITGTFIFSGILFMIAAVTAFYYFQLYYSIKHFIIFISCLVPVITYFLYWFFSAFSNKLNADYQHAMRMTLLSSCCMITCFCILIYLNH